MNFSYTDLLTINDIISDVLTNVGDEEQKLLTPGTYRRLVKEALSELNYETFFDVRFQDFDFPESYQLMIPSGAWNINDIYAYNGDCCDVGAMQTIHKKWNFLSRGKTQDNHSVGYTSRNNSRNCDPLYTSQYADYQVLFYNIDNGRIVFSDSCGLYQKVRIVYNGLPQDIDSAKIIPALFRVGITSYATERSLFKLKAKDPKLRIQWVDSKSDLIDKWRDCKYRAKRLDSAQRKDLGEYLSRMNY